MKEVKTIRKKSYKYSLKARQTYKGIRKCTFFNHHVRRIINGLTKIMVDVLLVARYLEVQQEVIGKLIDSKLLKNCLPLHILCVEETKVGENPLRCTTHDRKGLILTIVLFYPMF
jgi:hypothetical protein